MSFCRTLPVPPNQASAMVPCSAARCPNMSCSCRSAPVNGHRYQPQRVMPEDPLSATPRNLAPCLLSIWSPRLVVTARLSRRQSRPHPAGPTCTTNPVTLASRGPLLHSIAVQTVHRPGSCSMPPRFFKTTTLALSRQWRRSMTKGYHGLDIRAHLLSDAR